MIGARKRTPILKILNENAKNAKATLRSFMSRVSEVLELSDEIQQRGLIRKLKEALKLFTTASKEHSRWFLNNGAHQQSTAIRDERLGLHDEVDECVKNLNSSLSELGVDMESVLGGPAPSTTASLIDPKENIVDPTALNNNANVSFSLADDFVPPQSSEPLTKITEQTNLLSISPLEKTAPRNFSLIQNGIPQSMSHNLGTNRTVVDSSFPQPDALERYL